MILLGFVWRHLDAGFGIAFLPSGGRLSADGLVGLLCRPSLHLLGHDAAIANLDAHQDDKKRLWLACFPSPRRRGFCSMPIRSRSVPTLSRYLHRAKARQDDGQIQK